LRVVLREGFSTVAVRGKSIIEMHVRPEMGPPERERVLHRWYRQQLRQIIAPLLEKWQTVLGVPVTECRIKKMKTRWGTCNEDARRIWLNLELAKKPVQCIEYVMVHELVHLLERHHSDRFVAIMDRNLPQWRVLRQELNAAPLAHETWSY
jgi:predicted metal-dependent hydrolase